MSDEVKAVETPVPVQEGSPDKATVEMAEKRTGIKEVAQNEDLLATASDVPPPAPETPPVPEKQPSFFIEEGDRHRVQVDILYNPTNGQIVSISRSNLGLDFSAFTALKFSSEWFEFSIPSYEDMATYRQRSSSYRRDANKVLVDGIQLRNFLLVWHLKDWSMRDRAGQKVALDFAATGALSDESVKRVYKTLPTLVDVVLTILEKDILLT